MMGCCTSTKQPAESGVNHIQTDGSSVGTTKEMIVAAWKDVEADNFDTCKNDNTIASEIDEVTTIELSEMGFGEGSISLQAKAKANGTWALEGDQLTLKYASVDDVFAGEASLESDSLSDTLGADFVAEFLKVFPQEFKTEFPSTICNQAISCTVVSVDDNVLVTRDNCDGVVERQNRVSR